MAEIYTVGMWKAKAGEEREFIEAWREFAAWGSTMPGVGTLRLTRDANDPSRFLSFAPWKASRRSTPGRARTSSRSG
jgi:heme-degrading monooxygenase HmoA